MQTQVAKILLSQISDLGYAIERGVDHIEKALESDVDILLAERDRKAFIERVKASDLLLSATPAYGGVRLFLGNNSSDIKRVDCTWVLHFRGIPLLNSDHLLSSLVKDASTSFNTLPETVLAEIVFGVKNAYGGAAKYEAFLQQHGFTVLTPIERLRWLVGKVLRHPLVTILGAVACFMTYVRRFSKPTGITVGGITSAELEQSRAIKYLFQSRTVKNYGLSLGFLRSRLTSDICVIPWVRMADVDLSQAENLVQCEQMIINYLRKKRTYIE